MADSEISLRELVKKVGSVTEVHEVLKTGTVSSRCEHWQVAIPGRTLRIDPGRPLRADDWRQARYLTPTDGHGSCYLQGDWYFFRALNIQLWFDHVRERWPKLWPTQQKSRVGRPAE